jgi:hypothetical protein
MIKAVVKPGFSLSRMLRSPRPKEELVGAIVSIVAVGVKRLGIVWNSKNFRGGLMNPAVSKELLDKLEAFLEISQKLDWELPGPIEDEFDELIEDIETFNPAFRKALVRQSNGKRVTASDIEKSLKPK